MNSKVRFGFLLAMIVLLCSLSLKPKVLSQQAILDLVNLDRANRGLSELSLNPVLNLAALAKAEDMLTKNYFAHTSPEGATPWHWFKTMGYNYTYAGENLAEGYTDATDLEKSWMASSAARIVLPVYSTSSINITILPSIEKLISVLFAIRNSFRTSSL